jgi:hypothetical protein
MEEHTGWITHTEQTDWTTHLLITGTGCLNLVFNDTPQPGKTLKIYDGMTVLVILPLDKVFMHFETNEEGEEGEVPGIPLNVVFQHELRFVTDGQDVNVSWWE